MRRKRSGKTVLGFSFLSFDDVRKRQNSFKLAVREVRVLMTTSFNKTSYLPAFPKNENNFAMINPILS
jgi:hypothetical protein